MSRGSSSSSRSSLKSQRKMGKKVIKSFRFPKAWGRYGKQVLQGYIYMRCGAHSLTGIGQQQHLNFPPLSFYIFLSFWNVNELSQSHRRTVKKYIYIYISYISHSAYSCHFNPFQLVLVHLSERSARALVERFMQFRFAFLALHLVACLQ